MASPSFEEAQSLLANRQPENALQAFQSYIGENPSAPDLAEAKYQSLECLLALQRYADLALQAGQFRQQYPQDQHHLILIQQLDLRAATAPIAQGKFTQALGQIEQLLPALDDPFLLSEAEGYRLHCLYQSGQYEPFTAGLAAFRQKYPAASQLNPLRLCEAMIPLKREDWAAARLKLEQLLGACQEPGLKAEAESYRVHCLYEEDACTSFSQALSSFRQQHAGHARLEQLELDEALLPTRHQDWDGAARKIEAFKAKYPQSEAVAHLAFYHGLALARRAAAASDPTTSPTAQQAAQGRELLQAFLDDEYSSRADFVVERLGAWHELGRHGELLKETEAYLAAHPDKNRVWGEVMMWRGIAQYNSSPPDLAGAAKTFEDVTQAGLKDPILADHIPTIAAFWGAAVAQMQGDTAKARAMVINIRDEQPSSTLRTAALAQFGRLLAPVPADPAASGTLTDTGTLTPDPATSAPVQAEP